jgi:hypothetical protein
VIHDLPAPLRFPGLAGLLGEPGFAAPVRLRLDAAEWSRGETDLIRLDERADEIAIQGSFAVELEGGPPEVEEEIALHFQRWSGRRNAASGGEAFSRLLLSHRQLHPLEKALVRADYRHVLDVWQWVLRLSPGAGAAVQAAALFHDVERVYTEADSRREQGVADADYDGYKARHAEVSARVTAQALAEQGFDAAVRRRAVELVAGHDRPEVSADPEAALLDDADALSYFSLNSPGYLAYFGAEAARRKIAWTLARLSPAGSAWLPRLRLSAPVAALVSPLLSQSTETPGPLFP